MVGLLLPLLLDVFCRCLLVLGARESLEVPAFGFAGFVFGLVGFVSVGFVAVVVACVSVCPAPRKEERVPLMVEERLLFVVNVGSFFFGDCNELEGFSSDFRDIKGIFLFVRYRMGDAFHVGTVRLRSLVFGK